MALQSGSDIFLEILASEGVVHVFGNPGTTELPFIDALATAPQFEYVLVLNEGVAVAMADGYAQVTGRPSFVNLHSAPGLGNAMGVLTNVSVTGTPMVITAGQQDRRHLLAEPFLSGNLVEMARPLTKWAHEVHWLHDLGPVMRRAFQEAVHPPSGPVFVSIPMDLLEEEGEYEAPPRSRVERRTIPADLAEIAKTIQDTPAGRFALVAGDEVAASGGVAALVGVAEAVHCSVFGTPMHSNTVFPTSHPSWAGALPADAGAMREILSRFDTVLLIGTRGFMTFIYRPGSPLPKGVKLIHLSPSASDLGRIYPATLAALGDPCATLQALVSILRPEDGNPSSPLKEEGFVAPAIAGNGGGDDGPDRSSVAPLHAESAVQALVDSIPPGTIVVDEAVTNDPLIRKFHRVDGPGRFFYSRGGGLGWGIPAALGISLARDREPVACLVGDGSALYTIQALWTAVRSRLPVVTVVLNNGKYLILQRFLEDMRGQAASSANYVGIDLDPPPVDFVGLARSFGVDARRIEHLDDVHDAVRAALAAGSPQLIDLPLATDSD